MGYMYYINAKNKLQRLQNGAARIIQKSSNLMSSDTLLVLAQLNWCKLETRRLFHKAILMYKSQNNEVEGVNPGLQGRTVILLIGLCLY